MCTLFLDVASHDGMLACVTEDAVVASYSVDHRIDDRAFVEAVQKILTQVGWTEKDLTHIACVTGPGGFTSLRVGVAYTDALSSILSLPVAGIHLKDLWKARVSDETVWWLHSTKKTEFFVEGFGRFASIVPQPRCMTLPDASTLLQPGPWMGELLPQHQESIKMQGLFLAESQPLLSILPGFLLRLSYSQKNLIPWYGRGW